MVNIAVISATELFGSCIEDGVVTLEKVLASLARGLEEMVPRCNTVTLQWKEQAVCIILSFLLGLSNLFFLWWHAIVT